MLRSSSRISIGPETAGDTYPVAVMQSSPVRSISAAVTYLRYRQSQLGRTQEMLGLLQPRRKSHKRNIRQFLHRNKVTGM